MWKWLDEFYEVRRNHKERISVCLACEVFKVELANARRENERLLNHVLSPQPQSAQVTHEPTEPIRRHLPWKVKQQELEAADRKEAARILTEFKNKVNPAKTEELEKTMGIKADG